MNKLKNILVISALILIIISVSSMIASYQFSTNHGIVISCAVDLFFCNLEMTVFSISTFIIAIALLTISTMINK